jgi:hypothetical protein
MKVYVQTTLTPRMKVYDSESGAASEDTGLMGPLRRFLNPVLAVTDNSNNVVYKQGDFYPPTGFYIMSGLLAIGLGYGIIKLITRK